MGVRTWFRRWFRSGRSVDGAENGSFSSSPTELTGKSDSLQPVVMNGNTPKSLWDRAYDALDSTLVQNYEKLLSTKLQGPGGNSEEHVDLDNVVNKFNRQDAKSRHDQMKQVTEVCLERLDEKGLKYHIGSHEYALEDQIAKTVKVVQGMKDFITEAVKASPEASLAWTGVCIILPIFINPVEAKQANEEGFTYVTSRMKFYVALEQLLWPKNRKDDIAGLEQVRTELEKTIVDLYQHILTFQMKSILRYYQKRRFIFFRDLIQYDGWEGMRTEITKLEERVHNDSKQLNVYTSRKLFESMEEAMSEHTSLMANLQNLSEKQLEVSNQQLAVGKEQLGYHERAERRNESDKESECHQLFRLARDDTDSSYEHYKNLVDDAIEGTCEWFLTREEFEAWELKQTGLLVVSADPGCGKSVLAKYLIDKRLPGSSTICYFFFKDQLLNRENQALCALLHQLFSQQPLLIRHAMPEYHSNGRNLVKITSALWEILWKAASDPEAGSVVFVLDALDECDTEECFDLIKKVNCTFSDNTSLSGKAKFLLTTRPYSHIISKFDSIVDRLPHIHIPGESQSKMISEEVNLAISQKVDQLTNLKAENKQYLKERLQAVENRTYLWVSLVIKFIETRRFRKTNGGIGKALETLPMSVYEAYESILSKSDPEEDVFKALNLVLVAVTPLSVSEMNIAMNVDESTKSLGDLDLEDDTDFKATLRDMCGLFISIHDDKVYFIHQTARDFLLKKQPEASKASKASRTDLSQWNGTLSLQSAHLALAESCIFYIDSEAALKYRQFCQYAARNWIHHLRASEKELSGELASSVLKICDPKSDIHIRWPGLMGDLAPLCNKDCLWTAVCLQLGNVVQLLARYPDVKFESKHFEECTPLAYAAKEGYKDLVQVLLASGKVNVNGRSAHRRTPLILAIKGEKAEIANILLNRGDIDLNAKDETGRTALTWAAMRGFVPMVQFLLSRNDVDANAVDRSGKTPLFWAVMQDEILVVNFLLRSKKADPNVKDRRGGTPLSWATKNEQKAIQELLLNYEMTDPDLADQDD